MRRLLHRLAHKLGMNTVEYRVWQDRQGHWWDGVRCCGCDEWHRRPIGAVKALQILRREHANTGDPGRN
jgi:hypothetical protein